VGQSCSGWLSLRGVKSTYSLVHRLFALIFSECNTLETIHTVTNPCITRGTRKNMPFAQSALCLPEGDAGSRVRHVVAQMSRTTTLDASAYRWCYCHDYIMPDVRKFGVCGQVRPVSPFIAYSSQLEETGSRFGLGDMCHRRREVRRGGLVRETIK